MILEKSLQHGGIFLCKRGYLVIFFAVKPTDGSFTVFDRKSFFFLRSQTIIAYLLLYNEGNKVVQCGRESMRTYELYLIREDITKAYFGREFLLFDLFTRFAQSRSLSEKKVLYKQMKYITLPLQVMKLHHKMEQALRKYEKYERNEHMHIVSNENVYGEVSIKSQYIRMHTSENVELETAIFEVLRKCELTFLAMDYESKQYGWLNPLKQVRTYI